MELRLGRVAVVFAMVALGSTAAAEQRPTYGGRVRAMLSSEPISIDPVAAHSRAEMTLVSSVFDGLYRLSEHGIRPHLAAAMPAGRGRRVFIPIRKGVQFHDGTSLGPRDVASSLRRLLRSSRGWLLGDVRRIEASATGVTLIMRRSGQGLAERLAHPSASVTKGGEVPSWSGVNGTGGFRLEAFERSSRGVRLLAFAEHFSGRPYLDTVEFSWSAGTDREARLYEAGAISVSSRGQVAFVGRKPKYDTRAVESAPVVWVYLGFAATGSGIASNRVFRRALAVAIDPGAFAHVGTGERVVPVDEPVADRARGRVSRARRMLVAESMRTVALRRALRGESRQAVHIVVDSTRLGDREVGAKVAVILGELGLSAKLVSVGATEFALRRVEGRGDVFVDHAFASHRSLSPFVLSRDDAGWLKMTARSGPLSANVVRLRLRTHAPVVMLYRRGVRIHHWASMFGLAFGPAGVVEYGAVFSVGKPQQVR